jgi:hypothetical protein
MKPHIDGSQFGTIVIAGARIDHDVTIRLSGAVEKRRKKLSKAQYGTSHILSRAEAEYIYEAGVERLIVGSGQSGMLMLSAEAADFFASRKVAVDLAPTPVALQRWNAAKGATIGLFHVTC